MTGRRSKCPPFTHEWFEIEAIGFIVTYECIKCLAKKTRIKGKDKK